MVSIAGILLPKVHFLFKGRFQKDKNPIKFKYQKKKSNITLEFSLSKFCLSAKSVTLANS